MKNKDYRMDPDALIQSLRNAFLLPRDYTSSVIRLTNTINRLPKGHFQITHTHNGVFFYSDKKYLRKNSDLLYSLARKRYCETLLQVILLHEQCPSTALSSYSSHQVRLIRAFEKLEQLIHDFSQGNLKLERIILTPQQYAWYCRRYKQKRFIADQTSDALRIPQGDFVRSKSEQSIGNELFNFAVPCHYEEQLFVNVQKMVSTLKKELQQRNQLTKSLYEFQGYRCVWNVPAELSWMNSPGSIWRSYDDRTGCLQLYPDYTIMLADGSLLYWEHEGLMHHFFYRTNALERVEVLHQAGKIPKTRIIETNESEANTRDSLHEIIQKKILPYLWF